MPDTKQNERLARKMGWKRRKSIPRGLPCWSAPNGVGYANLPDFCGDDCAAVKWLLPFLLKQDPLSSMDFYPKEIAFNRHFGPSFSLALAAAVKAMEVKGGVK